VTRRTGLPSNLLSGEFGGGLGGGDGGLRLVSLWYFRTRGKGGEKINVQANYRVYDSGVVGREDVWEAVLRQHVQRLGFFLNVPETKVDDCPASLVVVREEGMEPVCSVSMVLILKESVGVLESVHT
jgi:hypothetical protein